MQGFLNQLLPRFSAVEIISAVVFYGIVRGIWWCIKQPVRITYRAFKNERQRHIHRHVHDGHKGSPWKCEHPACEEVWVSPGILDI